MFRLKRMSFSIFCAISFLILSFYATCFAQFSHTQGHRWPDSAIPVNYYINTNGAPSGAVQAIQNAFQTWENVGTSYMNFTYLTTTSLRATEDGYNVLLWGALPPGYIAGTLLYPPYFPIRERDIVSNSDLNWSAIGDPASNEYDVQNTATHEAGHWLCLNDLYGSQYYWLTMYGYGDPGETYKRTLHQGDIDGITYIYPYPLSVTILGPSHLYIGQDGQYTASTSGGSDSFSYQWYGQHGGTGWVDLGTTKSIYITDPDEDFTLKVYVTDSSPYTTPILPPTPNL